MEKVIYNILELFVDQLKKGSTDLNDIFLDDDIEQLIEESKVNVVDEFLDVFSECIENIE